MTFLIYGTLAYSTQNNRNTALTAIQNVLTGYTVENVATAYPAGVNTSGTTGLTISIRCQDSDIETLRNDLRTAWSSATRATTGHLITAVKED